MICLLVLQVSGCQPIVMGSTAQVRSDRWGDGGVEWDGGGVDQRQGRHDSRRPHYPRCKVTQKKRNIRTKIPAATTFIELPQL